MESQVSSQKEAERKKKNHSGWRQRGTGLGTWRCQQVEWEAQRLEVRISEGCSGCARLQAEALGFSPSGTLTFYSSLLTGLPD